VDYKIHTHATYAVCDAADEFQAAPAYTRKLASDKAKQTEQVGRYGLDPGSSHCLCRCCMTVYHQVMPCTASQY
jgi:hypothetical protein